MERKKNIVVEICVFMWIDKEMFDKACCQERINQYLQTKKNFEYEPLTLDYFHKYYTLTERISFTLPSTYSLSYPAVIAEGYFSHIITEDRRKKREAILSKHTKWVHTDLAYGDVIQIKDKEDESNYLFTKSSPSGVGIMEIQFDDTPDVD